MADYLDRLELIRHRQQKVMFQQAVGMVRIQVCKPSKGMQRA